MKFSVMAGIVFLAIGVISGYTSDLIVDSMGWETGLLTSFLVFGIFFALLVWIGRAKWGLSYLIMFSILGFISSWISGFLGDMWGISGAFYGSALTTGILFLLVLLLGQKQTGVQTA
jgi:hypothetical protein